MRIVAFILDGVNDAIDCKELELNYESFPLIGELLIHDNVHYRVADRYYISHSAEPMRAARVQYTLELREV